MKKALQISLAQTLFTIEDDAYAKLDEYLTSIKKHFAGVVGADDIAPDIEARIAEQFLESKKIIITLQEVDAVMVAMGSVADFDDEERTPHMATPEVPTSGAASEKRLYRDPDNAVIAGVASGLASYFGIEVVWVRIFFVLLTLASGSGLLLYIMLWIAMPEAKSATQKLQMAGNPVTLETLAETVRERVDEVKTHHGSTLGKIVTFPFRVIGKVLHFLARTIFPIVRIFVGALFAFVGFIIVLATSFALVVLLTNTIDRFADFPVGEVISAPMYNMLLVSAYLLASIPAWFIFLFGLSCLRKTAVLRAPLGFGLLGLWGLAFIASGTLFVNSFHRYIAYTETAPSFQKETRDFPLATPLTGLVVIGDKQVTLVQGTSTHMTMSGRTKDIGHIVVREQDGILTLTHGSGEHVCLLCDRRDVDIVITTPHLESITASHGADIVAPNWVSTSTLTVSLAYGAEAALKVDVPSLNGEVEMGSVLLLSGTVPLVELGASYGSRINTQNLTNTEATVTSSMGAEVELGETAVLRATADNGGAIEYSGTPKLTKSTDDGGQIYPMRDSDEDDNRMYIDAPDAPDAPETP